MSTANDFNPNKVNANTGSTSKNRMAINDSANGNNNNNNVSNNNNNSANIAGKQYPMMYPFLSKPNQLATAQNPLANNLITNNTPVAGQSTVASHEQQQQLNSIRGYQMERNNNQMNNQSNTGQNQTQQQITSMLSHSRHLPFPYNLNNFHRNF